MIELARLGGLSPVRQRGNRSAPEKKGVYAFIYPNVELFLAGATDHRGYHGERPSRADQYAAGKAKLKRFRYDGLLWCRFPGVRGMKDKNGWRLAHSSDVRKAAQKYHAALVGESYARQFKSMPHEHFEWEGDQSKAEYGVAQHGNKGSHSFSLDTFEVFVPAHKGDIRGASASRVAAKFQNKKQVDKADGSGKTTVYEYSKGQVDHRNREKAKRIEGLKGDISKLRSKVKTDLTDTDPKVRLTALAISLMDETCERVGNDESAEERGHFGVTTLQAKHIKINGGKATLTYTGKSGVDHKKTVTNSGTVKALKKALKGKSGDETVLCEGDDCIVRADDVNVYLKEYDITAKDIRGYRANDEMVKQLKEQRSKGKALPTDRKKKDEILKDEFTKALEATAELVGHESSTLRSQYLVPKLEDSYVHDGTVMDKWDKTASASVVVRRHLEASAALIDDNVDAFEEHFKLLSVLVTAHLRGDRQDSAIHNTWKVMIPRGREVMKGVLSTKEIPKRSAKHVEMAARMLGNTKHYSVPNNFFKWWEKNKKRFQVVLEAAKFADKTMGGEALFKIGKLTVHNTLAATGKELKDFKKALVAASRLIKKNSGVVPGGLSKILYGEVYYVGQLTRAHHAAWYNPSDDILYIRPPKASWGMDMVETIIHEFGHRYYMKYAPKDMKKEWYGHHLYGVKQLENDWEFQGLEVGEKIPMRVRGAPRGWRPVVSGVEGGFYLYEHWDGDKTERTDKFRIDNFRRKQESKGAVYPTAYASVNENEHFCESLKLLCAGKLPTPHLNAFEAIWSGKGKSASRVASRWLEAGLIEPPPKMVEAVVKWVRKVVAATEARAMEGRVEIEVQMDRDRNAYRVASLKRLRKALKDLKPLLKNGRPREMYVAYKALYEASVSAWGYGWVREKKTKSFSKQVLGDPSARKALVEDIKTIIKRVEGRVKDEAKTVEANPGENTRKQFEAEIKKNQALAGSTKPLNPPKPTRKTFPLKLDGWQDGQKMLTQLRKRMQDEVLEREEKAKKNPKRYKEDVEDGVHGDDVVREAFKEIAKTWKHIIVELAHGKNHGQGKVPAAQWHNRGDKDGRRVIINMPARDLERSVKHELRHMAQSFMVALVAQSQNQIEQHYEHHEPLLSWSEKEDGTFGFEKGPSRSETGRLPGRPSKKILTPQWRQRDTPKRPPYHENNPDKWTEPWSKDQLHYLDDVEFYTDLADNVAVIKEQVSKPKWETQEDRVLVFKRMVGFDLSKHKRTEYGGDLHYVDASQFFLTLKRFAKGKWKKAIGEAWKAVFGGQAKVADLDPQLGWPGGPCHVVDRINDEVRNPRLKEDLVDKAEHGRSLSNPEAHKVYDLSVERGTRIKLFQRIHITPHAQYRMDQRGITVNDLRMFFTNFGKVFFDSKSHNGVEYQNWSTKMAYGEEIRWVDQKNGKLAVVFSTAPRGGVIIVTTYWDGKADPTLAPGRGCDVPLGMDPQDWIDELEGRAPRSGREPTRPPSRAPLNGPEEKSVALRSKWRSARRRR